MLEVLREHLLGEESLVEDNKTDAIACPFRDILVLIILNERERYVE